MSIFNRRYPSAPPKIKKYMRKFETISDEYTNGTKNLLDTSKQLNEQYKNLTHGLKHSLLSRSSLIVKPRREPLFKESSPTLGFGTFITGNISKPTTSKNLNQTPLSNTMNCPPVNRSMPARLPYGAYKFYNSIATQKMKYDKQELLIELQQYPQLIYEYTELRNEMQVDPYFHVGGFPREDLIRSPDTPFYSQDQQYTQYTDDFNDQYIEDQYNEEDFYDNDSNHIQHEFSDNEEYENEEFDEPPQYAPVNPNLFRYHQSHSS